ncbi:hypothetical protein HMPREF9136_1760 [Prevotella dentalis DSM 3688]|uniref:Uncharacterized protein n=1 Tax=Prevotella dentalis (strain ATCC 49559 / DSM 3688 / JCM 13448 / NCTC 12043 / ES 2772) TaxID=908937 RepID=F9D4I2_PREDD|nr:hypothetical protein HMPREF9136_1760 [Prevotella dentalis DSM 3688]
MELARWFGGSKFLFCLMKRRGGAVNSVLTINVKTVQTAEIEEQTIVEACGFILIAQPSVIMLLCL